MYMEIYGFNMKRNTKLNDPIGLYSKEINNEPHQY